MRFKSVRVKLTCLIVLFGIFDAGAGFTLNSSLSLPGIAKDVEIRGTIAYVSTDSGLAAVDVSDRSNPVFKDFVRLPGRGNELSIHGDFAFVTDGTDKAGQIVGIANPDSLHIMGSIDDSCGYVWGIASREKSGSLGLVAVASLSGLSLFDVPLYDNDSAYGRLLARFSPYRWITLPPDSLRPCDSCWAPAQWLKTDDVVFDDTFAYLLYYDNIYGNSFLCLKKIDLSDISNPRCVDSLELYSFGCALAVSNGYAYVVHNIPVIGQWSVLPELDIIDVRTGPMTLKGSVRLPGRGEDVVIVGKQAFIACSEAGVSVVDVSDPQRPVQVDSFPFSLFSTPVTACGILPVDSNIFVAAGEGGLLAFKRNNTAVVRDRVFSNNRRDFILKTEFRSGSIFLRFRSGFSGNVSVSVCSIKGEMVLQRSFQIFQNRTATIRSVDRMSRPLKPGMYILRVKAAGYADAFAKVHIR